MEMKTAEDIEDAEELLRGLATIGPNGLCTVITGATKQLHPKLLLDFRTPIAPRFDASFFTGGAPRVRSPFSLFKRAVKSDRNTRVQRLFNVLTHERLLLPTVDVTLDFLGIGHVEVRRRANDFEVGSPAYWT